jgi:O-antigen/teichoic acid export membrane protein
MTSGSRFSDKVAVNMVTNLVRTAVTAVIGLVMVPYYIGELGIAVYGIIPLAASVTVYVMVTSDAVSAAVSRYMVIAVQSGDADEAGRVYSTSYLSMAAVVILLLPLVLLLAYASPYIFNIAPGQAAAVQSMFAMVMASALVLSMATCYDNIFVAYNKLYVVYTARIIQIVLQVLLIVTLFVWQGPSLVHVGSAYLLSSLGLFAAMALLARRTVSDLKVRMRLFDRGLMREMMGLGGWSSLGNLGTLLFIQASLIIVNLFMGAEVQGEFAIVVNIASMIGTTCFSVTAVFIPMVYYHYAQGDREGIEGALRLFTKFTGLFMAFPLAFLCVHAVPVLTAWVGSGFAHLACLVVLMTPVQVGTCSTRVLEAVPIMHRRVRPVALFTLLMGAINAISAMAVLTFTDWGLIGVASAWAVSMAVLRIGFLPAYAARLASVPLLSLLRSTGLSYLAFIAVWGAGLLIGCFWQLPGGWIPILTLLAAGYAVYMMLVFRFGLTGEERHTVAGFLPAPLQRHILR